MTPEEFVRELRRGSEAHWRKKAEKAIDDIVRQLNGEIDRVKLWQMSRVEGYTSWFSRPFDVPPHFFDNYSTQSIRQRMVEMLNLPTDSVNVVHPDDSKTRYILCIDW